MVRAAITVLCRIAVVLAALWSPVQAHARAADLTAIRQLMRKTWERPDAPLSVAPAAVAGSYTIAGWIRHDRGGRALLRRQTDTWEVVLCSGDQLPSAATAGAAGAPDGISKQLVERLIKAEKHMPPRQLTKLSLFDGIVRMDRTNPTPQPKH